MNSVTTTPSPRLTEDNLPATPAPSITAPVIPVPKNFAKKTVTPPAPATADSKVEELLKKMEDMKVALDKQSEDIAKREKALEEKEVAAQVAKPADPAAKAAAIEVHLSKSALMKQHFDNSPKVRIFIPKTPGEKGDTFWEKSFNGYMVRVPKGRYVDVPQPVAENIEMEFNQTEDAGSDFRLDRNENKLERLS